MTGFLYLRASAELTVILSRDSHPQQNDLVAVDWRNPSQPSLNAINQLDMTMYESSRCNHPSRL